MGTPATIPPPPPGYGPVSVIPPPPPGYGPVSTVPAAAPTSSPTPTPAAPPPTDAPSLWQRAKQHIENNLTAPSTDVPVAGQLNDMGRGVAKGAMQTAGGLLDIYRKLGSDTSPDTKAAADWFRQHSSTDGFWEGMGSGGEALAEFLGTEGVGSLVSDSAKGTELGAKVLSVADKLKSSGQVASFLSANPKIAKLAAIGMRVLKSGAEAGAQTYVKSGGDTGQTETGAALGVGLGAAGEGLVAGAKGIVRKLAQPSITTGAIEDAAKGVVTDRLGETNATRTMQPNRLPPSTGDYEFTIHGTPTEADVDGNIASPARKKQIGTQYVAGKGSGSAPKVDEYNHGSFMYGDEAPLEPVNDQEPFAGKGHKEPVFQYLTDSKPGTSNPGVDYAKGGGTLTTKDPEVASAHMGSLDRIIGSPEFAEMSPEQQQGYRAQRADIQQQIAGYYQHQKLTGTYAPNFAPVSVEHALSQTGDFSDAARHLEDAGKEVYEHANNVSGGQWQSLKDAIKDTSDKLHGLPDIPANARPRAVLLQKMNQMQGKMEGILSDPRNGIDRTDVDQAVRNFHSKFVLDEAHKAIQNIYDIEQHQPLKTGQYKGFNGNRLGQRWQAFLKERPEARDIIGSDRVDTLQRLFDANDTMASRKRFGNAIMSVGTALAGYHFGGLEGTLVGEGSYHAARMALNGILANPKAAKSLLFAIDSGARPENYAPGIAKMIGATTRVGRAAIPVAAQAIATSNGSADNQ